MGLPPENSTAVGCRFLLQGIFPTQGWNPCLLHWRVNSLPLSCLGGPTQLNTHYLIFSSPRP